MLTVVIDTAAYDDSMHAALRAAASEGPLAVDGTTGATVVFRYADIEALARDRRLAGVGLVLFDLMAVPDGSLRRWYGSLMFTNEGERHARLRSLVSRAFTPRSVDRLRETAATIAAAALSPLTHDGRGDLIAALERVPLRVMCALIGVPDEDVEVFAGWADDLSRVFGMMTPEEVLAADRSIESLLAYVSDLADDRRRSGPREDLVSRLLAAEDDGERLAHDEVLDMVANLIVGGHDTTASQIGCSLLALLRHPAELARVRDDRSLVPSAVSETIRFEPSIGYVPRTVSEPVVVAGTELGSGTFVVLATAAANREGGVWKEPDALDVARFGDPETARLLSFGAGPHYCLGANLARMTLEQVVSAVLDLGPVEPEADLGSVAWRQTLGRSPVALPVELAS